MNIELITKCLSILRFSKIEVRVYISLLKNGEMTVLQLSRETGIERTKLYRLLDSMMSRGVVVERLDYNKKFLLPCSTSVLEELAANEIENSSYLAKTLPSFLEGVKDLANISQPTTVKFYRGVEGIKQVLWNELSAKDNLCTYSFRVLQEVVSEKFFLKWSREVEIRGLTVKDLRSSEFLMSAKSFPALPFKGDLIRYVSPEVLEIPIEMDIYNDTVSIFNWHKGDVYAVEIKDEKLAKMQKQIFNILWEMGKEYSHEEWIEKIRKGNIAL